MKIHKIQLNENRNKHPFQGKRFKNSQAKTALKFSPENIYKHQQNRQPSP
jgi:hypothetical protein